jgi:PAS domain S-box-containing protein
MAMEIDLGRVFDGLPTIAWTALPDGHVDFVNRRWTAYTGLVSDKAHAWAWQAAIDPEDLPGLLDHWRSILASGEVGEMEARLRRFDGQSRRFLFQWSPMRDDAGRIFKWCGAGTDVEEFWQAEQAFRQFDFQIMVDSIAVPVVVTTPAGEVERLNQLTLDYYGRTIDELKCWKSSDAVHPDDLEQTVAAQTEAHRKGAAYDVESRHRRADGGYRWHNVRGFPLRDPRGRIVCWLYLLIDIDDRKRVEESLQQSEAFLAEGQHLARMGNFSWHVATGEIAWSEPLCRIFELDPRTPITLDLIAMRVHPEDLPLIKDMVERAGRGESDFEYQHRIVMPDETINPHSPDEDRFRLACNREAFAVAVS